MIGGLIKKGRHYISAAHEPPTTDIFIFQLTYGNDSDYPDVPVGYQKGTGSETKHLQADAPFLTRENQRCAKYGATVATIHTSDLNDFFRCETKKKNKCLISFPALIYDRFNDTRYATIGLRNTDLSVNGGKWQWFDGTATDYLDWGNMFPKTGDYIAQVRSGV